MDAMPLFSIIIPLYNSADLAVQVVEKLNQQTDKDFEVVLVNDGSTDDTARAVEEALKGAMFTHRFFSQENAGPGAARNNALEQASGKYILFLDADDFLTADAVASLHACIDETDADAVVFGYFQDFYTDETTISHTVTVIPTPQIIDGQQNIARYVPHLDSEKVYSFAWNKAIRATIVRENGIRFSDRRHSEDYFFYTEVFPHLARLAVVPKALYHYIKSPRETLTNQPYLRGFYSLITDRYTAMQRLLKNAGVYDGQAAALAASVHIKHIFSHFSNNFAAQSGMNGRARRADIRKTLADPLTKEALRLAVPRSRADKIMVGLLRSCSPFLCYCFALAIYKLRNNKLFDKLK